MENQQLQSVLRSKIGEAISILELRISLNAQTIIPCNVNVSQGEASSDVGISKAKSISTQNQRAQKAIKESVEAIHKLEFIKACISKTEIKSLYDLFGNYNQFSLKDLERKVFKVTSVRKTTHSIPEVNY